MICSAEEEHYFPFRINKHLFCIFQTRQISDIIIYFRLAMASRPSSQPIWMTD